EERDCRVQSPAGKQHQRETGPGLLIADANRAFFVELATSSFARLLSKYAWHRGHRRCRGAGFQYVASCRIIHIRVLSEMTGVSLPDEAGHFMLTVQRPRSLDSRQTTVSRYQDQLARLGVRPGEP